MAVLAVDCGGTNVLFGWTDSPAEARVDGVVPTPREVARIPAAILEAVRPLLGEGVAAGSAGLVDREAGTLLWSPHSSGGPVALRDELAAGLGRPVVVDNDANLAALAEARLGAGRGYRMVLLVALGTGIGGGRAVAGEIERGRGFLGELGPITLDPAGPVCACGRRGCWEALVSGKSLARAAAGASPRGEHLSAAAARGDAQAAAALAAAGPWAGRGLANLVAVLGPDVIVLGGGAAAAGEALLGPARAELAATVSAAGYRAPTPLAAARFGTRAGLVGAALAAEEAAW